MSIHSKKLELIRIITEIQSETLLERLSQLLNQLYPPQTGSKASVISDAAAELVLKINEGLPEDVQRRYYDLAKKSVNASLIEEELAEYQRLTPIIEEKTAERLGYIIQLAALWNCSVDETMNKLGIEIPDVISN